MPRAGLGKGSADDTKLHDEVNMSEGKVILQGDLDRLEEWASNKSMKFNKDTCKALHVGQHNKQAQYKPGSDVAGEQPC